MKKVTIIYWSGTGNTEKMANLISKGASEAGGEVKLLNVSDASIDSVNEAEILVMGSPSMGNEVIEETEMDPFIESISQAISGKRIALFGSYGWGCGEWMTNWVSRMEGYGANLVEEGLIVQGEPEGESEDLCIELGKKLVV